ncbi:CRISPR-associated protein, TIGR03984 family [Cylindrospermum stagnale PCC 7417]|uniref:CRISPR-associated protein, TIGR03984 family n=1 Tax=Cylindrospermum stagnale PCC 7417 TaxID=56107 RepID=K9X903_9NOST|nr:CRISPR-associated protein Csx19 [Cylindrospermum stagnale]AFZ28132.1 CRISPR-associated protein, TIGR03984 family [Cylindrospermum stagnale PCC 7417]
MNQKLCQTISVDEIRDDDQSTLINWLQKEAKEYQFKYLLAYAEDGIIWGHFDEDENYKIITADIVFHKNNFAVDFANLRLLTLQQCRIFGENGEILLWKSHKNWQARLIKDNPSIEYIHEEQILWGTQIEKGKNGEDGEKHGFTLLSDGSQGLKHAVPLTSLSSYFSPTDKKKLYRPVRLVINHYIKYDDETGIARIFLSRLVSLKAKAGVK